LAGAAFVVFVDAFARVVFAGALAAAAFGLAGRPGLRVAVPRLVVARIAIARDGDAVFSSLLMLLWLLQNFAVCRAGSNGLRALPVPMPMPRTRRHAWEAGRAVRHAGRLR
jgi:hypothetical protein